MNPFPSKVGDSPASGWDLLGLMPLQPELPSPPTPGPGSAPQHLLFPSSPHQARVPPGPSSASRYFLQQLPPQGSFLFLGVGHGEDQLAGRAWNLLVGGPWPNCPSLGPHGPCEN